MSGINAGTCQYCYLDIDIDNHRSKLALAAAFVDATDSRYGFSSKDLRKLGGSEIGRVQDSISTDHEWSGRNNEIEGIRTRPPSRGSRIVIRLLWDVAPLACENFATLCVNGGSLDPMDDRKQKKAKPAPVGESGKPLTYRGSNVHRVVPGFIMQGGDFVFGNGSGGESIYNGKKFKDERSGLALKHDRKGVVSMGNSGKNSNTSQFFITFERAPQCDGKHVIFGEVLSGFEVLDAVEEVGSSSGGGEPTVPVTITDCGPFRPLQTAGAGYWYDQPDADSYTGISPTFMVRPRVAVFAPSTSVVDKFRKAMGTFAAPVLISVDKEASEQEAVKKVEYLLAKFCIDLIIVAPACSEMLSSVGVPESWNEMGKGPYGDFIEVGEIIVTAKPVEVMSAIWTRSWVGKQRLWQVDGKNQ